MIYELIYIGKEKGSLQGVPARNLTELDIDAICAFYTVEELIASGLYMRPVVDLQPEDAEKIINLLRQKDASGRTVSRKIRKSQISQ